MKSESLIPGPALLFEEILSRANGNFEEQKQVLEFSIIVINF